MEMKDLKRKVVRTFNSGQAAYYQDKDKTKPIPNFEDQTLLRVTTVLAETRGIKHSMENACFEAKKRRDKAERLLLMIFFAVITDMILHFIW